MILKTVAVPAKGSRLDCSPEEIQEMPNVDRLGHAGIRAASHRQLDSVFVIARHEEDRKVWPCEATLTKKIEAIKMWHLQIGDDGIKMPPLEFR